MINLQVLFVQQPNTQPRQFLDALPWSELEMTLIDCVDSSALALQIIDSHHVDILIADVNARKDSQSTLIEYIAENRQDILVIAIADTTRLESVLLAMRYQTVYDFLHTPLDSEELCSVLKSAGQYWSGWSISMAIAQLSDIKNFHLSGDKKGEIDSSVKKILSLAVKNKVDELPPAFEHLFRDILCTQYPSDDALRLGRMVATEIIVQFRFLLIGMDLEASDEFMLYSFMHKLMHTKTGADLEDLCQNYLYQYIQLLVPQQEKKQISALVRDALRITEEKYSDANFTLVSLSDELGVSANYLSSVFKMETGMRFKKYLNTYRIDKAKELLMDSRYKIYEVSDLVGIEDSRYFSQIFKTYIGMKPSEYRKSNF